jgi:hypothetical protein
VCSNGQRIKKIKEMRVCVECRRHLLNLLLVGGFSFLAISSWRGDDPPQRVKLIWLQNGDIYWCLSRLNFSLSVNRLPFPHHVNAKGSDQQYLCSATDIKIFPIINAGVFCLLLMMANSLAWAITPMSKMRDNNT